MPFPALAAGRSAKTWLRYLFGDWANPGQQLTGASAKKAQTATTEKADATALYTHIMGEWSLTKTFPAGLERMRAYVEFALRIIVPEASASDRVTLMEHITPTECKQAAARLGLQGDCKLCEKIQTNKLVGRRALLAT